MTSSTSINDPPGAPASLQLSAGSIIFRWKAASDPRVAGYKIYVGTLPGIYDTVLDAGKETTYHWEDTQINQVYYAVVKSYDSLGLLSAPTNEARMVAKTGRGSARHRRPWLQRPRTVRRRRRRWPGMPRLA